MKNMLDKMAGSEDQDHADAKMQVLQELREMAMNMMGDKVRDKLPSEMHGVEIMAPDQEGLREGLDLAQEVLPSDSQEDAMEEVLHPGLHAEVAEADDMFNEMSPEELEEQIQHLKRLKQEKMMR